MLHRKKCGIRRKPWLASDCPYLANSHCRPGRSRRCYNGKKNRALLAVLALSPGQAMTRERLASLLWGDRGEEQARNSLRQSLAVLRKELGPDGSNLIRSLDEALKLQMEATAVDVLDVVAELDVE